MYVGFGSIPYLAPQVEGTDIREPLKDPPPRQLVRSDRHAAFVFLPERRGELDLVRQTFPNGELQQVPVPNGNAPLFVVYRVGLDRLAS